MGSVAGRIARPHAIMRSGAMSPKSEPSSAGSVVDVGVMRGAVCQGVREIGGLTGLREYDRLVDLVDKENACSLPGVRVKYGEF